MTFKHLSTSAFLAAGVALPVLVVALGAGSLNAQQPKQPTSKSTPTPKGGANANTASTPAGQRTETMVYDAWTVSCRELIGVTGGKACSAVLSLSIVEEGKRPQTLGAW